MGRSWVTRLALPLAMSQLFGTGSAQLDSVLSSIASDVASATEGLMTVPSTLATVTGSASPSSASASESPSPTASREPVMHKIKAGPGAFIFEPAELHNVSVGDIIDFEFYPPDHSVARAEYLNPCVPYEYTGKNKTGFWSTTQWVDTIEDITHWNLTINSTEPIFFYCAAPNSCKGELMVGVINPNETQTLEKQREAAGRSQLQLQPGDPIPKEGTSSLSSPDATGTSSPSSGGGHSPRLSGGAIAGIVVGAVAFLVICAALFFYVGRTKSLKDMMNRKDATVAKPTGVEQQFSPNPAYPYSPAPQQDGFGGPPQYGQHNATDGHPSSWPSPTMHQGHMSMMSGMSQPGMAENKTGYAHQGVPAEMASPEPTFTAELEAPNNDPHKPPPPR